MSSAKYVQVRDISAHACAAGMACPCVSIAYAVGWDSDQAQSASASSVARVLCKLWPPVAKCRHSGLCAQAINASLMAGSMAASSSDPGDEDRFCELGKPRCEQTRRVFSAESGCADKLFVGNVFRKAQPAGYGSRSTEHPFVTYWMQIGHTQQSAISRGENRAMKCRSRRVHQRERGNPR